MGCCGKIRNIATGYTNLALGKKYKFTDNRIRICQKCEEQTWMSKTEYAAWLLSYGVDIIKNFSDLKKLPRLPKHKQIRNRRNIFCRICKCFIPAKARVEDEQCPLKKW